MSSKGVGLDDDEDEEDDGEDDDDKDEEEDDEDDDEDDEDDDEDDEDEDHEDEDEGGEGREEDDGDDESPKTFPAELAKEVSTGGGGAFCFATSSSQAILAFSNSGSISSRLFCEEVTKNLRTVAWAGRIPRDCNVVEERRSIPTTFF